MSLEKCPFPLLSAKRMEKIAAGGGTGGAKKKKQTNTTTTSSNRGVHPSEKKKSCFEERSKSKKVREIWPALFSAPSFPSSICSPEWVQHCLSFLVFPVARASQFQSRGEGVHMEGPMGRGGSWPLPRSAGADSGASVT